MPGIPEQYIQVKLKDKPIYVASVQATDSTSLEILKRDAAKNLDALLTSYEVTITRLERRCEKLENEIKTIKGE